MDFKVIYFDNELDMLEFADRFWDRVFNICYISQPDVGDIQGWQIRLKPHPGKKGKKDSPSITGIMKP